MTDPYLDLYICIINFITGIFIYTLYYGVLLIENNKNKYIVYLLDILSIFIILTIYLFIISNNNIKFHIYHIIFLSLGYILSFKYLKNQLTISYQYLFIILSYIYDKVIIIIKWGFSIIPITLLIKYITNKLYKYKLKRTIIKFNKRITNTKEISDL